MIKANKIEKINDITENLKIIKKELMSVVQQNATEINATKSYDPHMGICVTTYFNTLAIIDAALSTSIDALEKGFIKHQDNKQH